MPPSSSPFFPLLSLPNEILDVVVHHLDFRDIRHLSKTCKQLAYYSKRPLLAKDIDDKRYTSLAWACFHGNASLAKAAFDLGKASVNVVFWPPNRIVTIRTTGYDSLVYPKLASTCYPRGPCSALNMATMRDHVDVIKELLARDADLVEPDLGLGTRGAKWPAAPVCFSHVISAHAAEVLLECQRRRRESGDPREFIPSINRMPYLTTTHTPLEMLLKYNIAHIIEKSYGMTMEIDQVKLYPVVMLFLAHGANPRMQRIRQTGLRTVGALTLALKIGHLEVITAITAQLIYFSGQNAGPNIDLRRAMRTAMDECEPPCLEALIQGGVSPNMFLENPSARTLPDITALQWAMRMRNFSALRKLIELGAYPASDEVPFLMEFIHDSRMQDMESRKRRRCPWQGLICAVAWAASTGAALEERSFGEEGYTPLMFATSDRVRDTDFEDMIMAGADRRAVGRWHPGAPLTSVMQCLLFGLRTPHPDEGLLVGQVAWGRRLRVPKKDINRYPRVSNDVRRFRAGKFLALVGPIEALKREDFDLFVTPDNRHMLEWAAEDLYGHHLKWAVEFLSPYYTLTRPVVPGRSPFFSLFGDHRYPYNHVGTLYDTLRSARTMVLEGVPADLH